MPREGALLPHTSESRLSALPVAVLCALVVALLAAAAGGAQAASVVGPGGEVTGCYVKKAKKKKGTRFIVPKGTLRVVPPGKRCKKGERQIAWNAVGQPGQTGSQGGSGQVSVTTLQDRVTQLQDRVTQLESILSGVTNGGLLGAIASVNSLCAEVPTVVGQVNGIRSVLSGLSLSGVIPGGLLLTVPAIPSALPSYACP